MIRLDREDFISKVMEFVFLIYILKKIIINKNNMDQVILDKGIGVVVKS